MSSSPRKEKTGALDKNTALACRAKFPFPMAPPVTIVVQFRVLELFRAGPCEQFLAVHQRDFEAQVIK